jgi:hypothetical protein
VTTIEPEAAPPAARRRPGPDEVALRWQLWLPCLSLGAILLSVTRTDPDLWGHVRFGLDWLRSHRLPAVDPYSFTQDRPWINHEWLSEAMMGAAFQAGGAAGLVLLKAAVMSGAIAVLLSRLRGASPLLSAAVALAAIVGTLPLSATVRPQVWSVLGLALLAPLLDGPRPDGRRVLLSAALFAVWANLHGGWITGGAVVAVHVAIRGTRAPGEAIRWLALGAASLGGTLLNPYGVGLWRFLATTIRLSRPDISEWQPFGPGEPAIMWVSIVVPVVLMGLLARRRGTRPRSETIAVVCVMVLAGLRISRIAPLILIPALAFLAPWIARAWGKLGALTVNGRAGAAVLLLPGILAVLATPAPVSRLLSCLPIRDRWAPDRVAAASLIAAEGRLWTTFDWGEYSIWHFGPALRVSIDGRRETVYSGELVEWHRAVERGDTAALQRLADLAPEYVWLPASRQAARAGLVSRGYRIDVETPGSFVAVRSDLGVLAAAAPPLSSCFP